MHDSTLSASLPPGSCWLVCETKLRQSVLERSLPLGKGQHRVLTTTEVLAELASSIARREFGRSYRALRKEEVNEIVAHLLRRNSKRFPELLAGTARADSPRPLSATQLDSIRRFIDLVRMNQAHEYLTAGVVDRYGGILEDKTRMEELIFLIDSLQAFQREHFLFDSPALAEFVLEYLNLGRLREVFRDGFLPQLIIFDQPTFLFRVEQLIWRRIAELTQVRLYVHQATLTPIDGEYSLSSRFSSTMREFLESLDSTAAEIIPVKESYSDRDAVIGAMLDDAPRTGEIFKGVRTLRCRNRSEEVRQVCAYISRKIEDEGAQASDFQIVAFELDQYYKLLVTALEAGTIPYLIPKGEPLENTPAGRFLNAFLGWLTVPSVQTAVEYFAHPLALRLKLTLETLQNFAEKYPVFELALRTERLATVLSGLSPFDYLEGNEYCFDPARIAEAIQYFDLPDSFQGEWVTPILECAVRRLEQRHGADPMQFLSLCADISILNRELSSLESARGERQPSAMTLSILRKRFFQGRKTVRHYRLKQKENDADPSHRIYISELRAATRAWRAIRHMFRTLRERLELLESNVFEGSPLAFQDFESIVAELRLELRRMYSKATSVPSGVYITELLDSRALRDKNVIILGATADAFPPRSGEELVYGSELDRASLELLRRTQTPELVYEAYWLLGEILRGNREIVFTVPFETEARECVAASFLNCVPSEDVQEFPQLSERELRSNRSVVLLASRGSARFTPYDGNLPTDEWASMQAKLLTLPLANVRTYYTVSDLETLSVCPHRYYFKRVLGLDSEISALPLSLAVELGTVVHETLAAFFSTNRKELIGCNSSQFAAFCREVLAIGERILGESEFDWSRHPLLRAMRERIFDGLESGDDTGRRGYLKAALILQRSSLETVPGLTEFSFGNAPKGAPPYRINGPNGEIYIHGVIDRIDFEPSTATAVTEPRRVASIWDYKTGKAPTRSEVIAGESLQLPLYAAVIGHNFKALPKRGGCIVLHRPNVRDQDGPSGREDAIVEHLAIALRRGDKSVNSDACVHDVVDRAIARVIALDHLAREGEFHQIEDTKICFRCEFKRACGRDELLLQRKLQGSVTATRTIRSPTKVPLVSRDREKRRMALLSQEQSAATETSENVAVIAGAGSGKTHVLQNRIIRLLLSGVPLESIVAITFTEKAANEIRIRIEEALSEIISHETFEGTKVAARELSLLREAKGRISLSRIGTIHAFAGTVLQMAPELSRLDPRNGILDQASRDSMLERAVGRVFLDGARGEEIDAKGKVVEELLRAGISWLTLRKVVTHVAGRSTLAQTLRYLVDEDEPTLAHRVKSICDIFTAEEGEKLRAFVTLWVSDVRIWFDERMGASELSDEEGRLFDELISRATQLTLTLDRQGEWVSEASDILTFLEAHPAAAKRVTKKNPRNFWHELRNVLRDYDFPQLQSSLESEMRGLKLATQVIELALAAQKFFIEEKERHGVVDFDDLIDGAYELLCCPMEGERGKVQDQLLTRLRKQFTHFLVDEFQDTDNRQWAIIRAIAGGEADSIPGSLFLVGDSKQAIYSFRGGDMRVFQSAAAEICAAGGKLNSLRDNYRTRDELLSFINEFFDRLFAVDFSLDALPKVSTAVSPERMNCKRADTEEKARAVSMLHLGIDEQNENGEGSDVAEARLVSTLADELIEELQSSRAESALKWPMLQQYAPGSRIAIITRTVRQLTQIASALENLNLPFLISHSAGFYDLDEIQQFDSLLRFLSYPTDTVSLIGTLRSPLIGLSDAELVQLRLELEGDWKRLLATSSEFPAGSFANMVQKLLTRWQSYATCSSPSMFLKLVCEDAELEEVYRRALRPEAWDNIERYLDRLRDAELSGELSRSIHQAVQWIEMQRRSPTRAPNANSVRHDLVLMTIHGAKGLEFPMVILPFLSSRSYRDEGFSIGEVTFDGHELPLLSLRIEDEQNGFATSKTCVGRIIDRAERLKQNCEERRVFYVACTRARDYLVLTFREGANFKAQQSRIEASGDLRNDAIFSSSSPQVWLRNMMTVDDPTQPCEWKLTKKDGGFLHVPIIRSHEFSKSANFPNCPSAAK